MTFSTVQMSKAGARMIREAGYDGCVELRNETTRVVLEPNLGGRVLSYQRNGVEILYPNPSQHGVVWDGRNTVRHPSAGRFDIGPEYGGLSHDELWMGRWQAKIIATSSDTAVAGARLCEPQHVDVTGHQNISPTLRLTEPRSARLTSATLSCGLQLVREFAMASDSSHLRCTQIFRNHGTEPIRTFHWGRTFVVGNGIALAPVPKRGRFPRGYALGIGSNQIDFQPLEEPNVRIRENILEIIGQPSKAKFILDVEPGWLAYVAPNGLLFLKKFPVYPNRAYGEIAANNASFWYSSKENAPNWPDENQVVEIEPIGPLEIIAPGEERSFIEDWWLENFSFPEDRQVNLKELRKIIETADPEGRARHSVRAEAGQAQQREQETETVSIRVFLLPRPMRNEWGEDRGEGNSEPKRASSPRPSPPSDEGEGGNRKPSEIFKTVSTDAPCLPTRLKTKSNE